MNNKTKRAVINWVMIVSLVIVMVSGMLLRPMPGMWVGILHTVSALALTISIIIHCFQHRRKKR